MKWIERHIVLSVLLLLLGVATIAAFWQATVLLALLGFAGYGLYRYTLAYDQHHQAARARRQALAVHADYEHHLLINGDARGLYGRYQPYC